MYSRAHLKLTELYPDPRLDLFFRTCRSHHFLDRRDLFFRSGAKIGQCAAQHVGAIEPAELSLLWPCSTSKQSVKENRCCYIELVHIYYYIPVSYVIRPFSLCEQACGSRWAPFARAA